MLTTIVAPLQQTRQNLHILARDNQFSRSGASGQRVCVYVAGGQRQFANPDMEDRHVDAGSRRTQVREKGRPPPVLFSFVFIIAFCR